MERLYSTRATSVINKLKAIFARHGIPEKLVTDNGPQFASAEFAQFAESWGFRHCTSSPRYPQSNGLAEKSVQTAERIIVKAAASGRDPYTALLEYRTMPISDCGKSPAQLLMSRRLRSILPPTHASLQPAVVDAESTRRSFEEKQVKQKRFYDRTAKSRTRISAGDHVLLKKNTGRYQPAIVTEEVNAPRSYVVRTRDGAVYRRTSHHLNKPRHYHADVPCADTSPDATSDVLGDGQQTTNNAEYPATPRPHSPSTPTSDQRTDLTMADHPCSTTAEHAVPRQSRYGRTYKPTFVYDA